MITAHAQKEFLSLEKFMSLVYVPFFVIDVSGPKQFSLRSINQCYIDNGGGDLRSIYGKDISEAFPKRLAETLIENYEICRASGEPYKYEENLVLDNEPKWWATTLSPVKDHAGEVTQLFGIALDITRHKEIELDSVATVGKITKLNEELQLLASIAAKDTRGPLETILSLLSILEEGFLDLGDQKHAQLRMAISKTEETIERLGDIIASAGKMSGDDLRLTKFNIGHLCRDIFAQADRHGQFDIKFPDELIETDRAVAQIVLRQLIENSAYYSKGIIHVSMNSDVDGDGFLEFSVCDDGIGEREGCRPDRQKIMPLSEREENLAGLFACQGLVRSIGGKVWHDVSEEKGQVTIFFTLPTRQKASEVNLVTAAA